MVTSVLFDATVRTGTVHVVSGENKESVSDGHEHRIEFLLKNTGATTENEQIKMVLPYQ